MDALKALINLRKRLRRKASIEYKRVGNDATRYEGMSKGMYVAYEESATMIDKIIKEISKGESDGRD